MATAAPTPTQPPNPTLYIRNLEESIKLPTLTSSLRELFSDYGTILDIIAKKNLKAKGQAFIVFDNVDAATTALEEIQGFELFDKPMVLDFAKSKSDATVAQTGDDGEMEAHKRRRLAEKERRQAVEVAEREKQKEKLKRPAPVDEAAVGDGKVKQQKVGGGLKSTGAKVGVVPDEYLPPNKTLFLQNLPDETTVEELEAVFGRFEGFTEARLVPVRKGIAFVEFQAEVGAISAKENTAGMAMGAEGKPMKVTYQRK